MDRIFVNTKTALEDLRFSDKKIHGDIDLINKIIKSRRISNLFLCYNPNDSRFKRIVKHFDLKADLFRPALLGWMEQRSKYGLVFVIGASERELRLKNNTDRLEDVLRVMEYIKHLTGAVQVSYAGIIPSVLDKFSIKRTNEPEKLTAYLVAMTIQRLLDRQLLPNNTPVIIIGASGFVGASVVYYLLEDFNITRLSKIDIINRRIFPGLIKDMDDYDNILIVNISTAKSLPWYLKKVVNIRKKPFLVLSETYPPPDDETIKLAMNNNGEIFLIIGVWGKIFPPLPMYNIQRKESGKVEYVGIPFCAALQPDKGDPPLKILFKKCENP